jgi:hypothetical protein
MKLFLLFEARSWLVALFSAAWEREGAVSEPGSWPLPERVRRRLVVVSATREGGSPVLVSDALPAGLWGSSESSSSSSGRAVLAMELSFLRWCPVPPGAAYGADVDCGSGSGIGITGSSSLESSKRLRNPEEKPLGPSSSLESANRLENREPELLFPPVFDPDFFPPPYERLKLGMRMPPELFLPEDWSRRVVRIWGLADVLASGEPPFCLESEPAGESVLSENLFEEG